MILPSINLIAGCTLVRIPNYVLYSISEILFVSKNYFEINMYTKIHEYLIELRK